MTLGGFPGDRLGSSTNQPPIQALYSGARPVRRIHIALSVQDLDATVADYTHRLGQEPEVVIAGSYALWRTESVNLSVRCTEDPPGTLRHLGWEDPAAERFTVERDVNGIAWERFHAGQQAREIRDAWPESRYEAR